MRVPPASFATLATILRASLDQAASDREFLQARNCLVTAALYAVDGAEYVSWLREHSGGGGGGGGGITESLSSAVMADSELVSAAGRLDEAAAAGGEGSGEQGAGVDYLLLRELRRHSVWATIELWEVSLSDSVVVAMEGGGARAERWLPGSVVMGLKEVCTCRGRVAVVTGTGVTLLLLLLLLFVFFLACHPCLNDCAARG